MDDKRGLQLRMLSGRQRLQLDSRAKPCWGEGGWADRRSENGLHGRADAVGQRAVLGKRGGVSTAERQQLVIRDHLRVGRARPWGTAMGGGGLRTARC